MTLCRLLRLLGDVDAVYGLKYGMAINGKSDRENVVEYRSHEQSLISKHCMFNNKPSSGAYC